MHVEQSVFGTIRHSWAARCFMFVREALSVILQIFARNDYDLFYKLEICRDCQHSSGQTHW